MQSHYRTKACAGLLLLAAEPGIGEEAADESVSLSATYTADFLRNAHGGLAVGNAYLDNLDVVLEVDGERAVGIPGLKLFAYGLYNNSARFSERYPGDVSTASNIDAPRAVRLYEAWGEWSPGANEHTSLRFGLYDLNSEFDVLDARGLFLNSSFGVGHELAQTGQHGPSIFPVTSLGVRLAMRASQSWLIRVAAMDGVPGDPNDSASTTIRLSEDDGALLIGEAEYSSEALTKLAVGVWHYTQKFARIDDTIIGADDVRTGDSSGVYAQAEFALWSRDDGRALDAFARVGAAEEAVNEYGWTAQAGLVLHHPFSSEADESLGLAISRLNTGGAFRRAQAQIGEPIGTAETIVELTYRRMLTPWLTLQPDIQYIQNPGASRSLRDALVVGLRVEVSGAW